YRLLKAASAYEALNTLATCEEPVDLVLTDSMMPGMSGPEFARRLLPTHASVPVIVMSGYTQILAGLDWSGQTVSLLQKPFTPTELRARIRQELSTRPRKM